MVRSPKASTEVARAMQGRGGLSEVVDEDLAMGVLRVTGNDAAL